MNNQNRQLITARLKFVYGLVFAVFIAMLAGIVALTRTAETMSKHHVPLVSAAHEIRIQVTGFHLWFEEFIQGDSTPSSEIKMWEHLDMAERYAEAMLNGGNAHEGIILPLDDPLLSTDIEQAITAIRELRKVGLERLKAKETSAIGSAIEQRFDSVYARVMDMSVNVEGALLVAIEKDNTQFKVFSNSVIFLMVLAAFVVARLIFHYENIRGKYERRIHTQAFHDVLTQYCSVR